jgi:hypothetical protein
VKTSLGRSGSVGQTKQNDLLQPIEKYSKESSKHKKISRKLAVFVGSSNVAYHIMECQELKDLLFEVDTRYCVPGRSVIYKELVNVLSARVQ